MSNSFKNKITSRNFQMIEFVDTNQKSCSLQQSSTISDGYVAIERLRSTPSNRIWLGMDTEGFHRMHLDRKMVKSLVKSLRHWLKTGDLFE